MADWGRTLEEIIDGMTMPQFRLLSKMQQRRTAERRRWDLQVASLHVQSEAQMEALTSMMEALGEVETGVPAKVDMGGGFTVSKRYPLLHELTPQQVAMDRRLKGIVKFRLVKEETGGEP